MSSSEDASILAVDIGNSNIKFGVYRNDRWERRFRINTVRTRTPDEYGLVFHSLLSEAGIELADFTRAVVSSVVPPLTPVIGEMLAERMGRDPLVVGAGVRTGIRIRTDNPVDVGADIVANAVAAHAIEPDGTTIVVAFGTALTFSAVTRDGDLLGVAIAPGMQPAAESLVRDTAQLRLVDYSTPPSALGKNTIHSLQSGLVFGYVGLVEGLVDRITSEIDEPAGVISTGEQARYITPLTDRLGRFEPWLTLDGLRRIAERNM